MYGQWSPQMQEFQKNMSGALRAASRQTAALSSNMPNMAEIAQIIRRREKDMPGLLTENSLLSRPRNKVARQAGRKKTEIFGGAI